MPLTNECAVLNLKINGYLKFYFFNGWNKPLTERLEKVGTCPSPFKGTVVNRKYRSQVLAMNYLF